MTGNSPVQIQAMMLALNECGYVRSATSTSSPAGVLATYQRKLAEEQAYFEASVTFKTPLTDAEEAQIVRQLRGPATLKDPDTDLSESHSDSLERRAEADGETEESKLASIDRRGRAQAIAYRDAGEAAIS